ncbi:hypothetical protein niasHT_012559 [Heterodera trifolii]|uniref:Probable pectate lyase F n=1 Tax=Heterodera trifolii TaxID=157864 RepID=A0ABD2L198_9BILA
MNILLLLSIALANFSPIFGQWPTAKGTETVPKTIIVNGGTKDFGFKRLTASSALGDGGLREGQKPIISASNGAVIRNLIIGPNAADGIHCMDGCTLQNVWWEDVGEDAATFRSTNCKNANFLITGGGARKAHDKVFQFNGGGTVTVKNFVADNIGKLGRSCGNCMPQCKNRKFVFENIKVTGVTATLCGINQNYGDTATIKNVQISGGSTNVCSLFKGNDQQKQPSVIRNYKVGEAGDGKNCVVSGTSSG